MSNALSLYVPFEFWERSPGDILAPTIFFFIFGSLYKPAKCLGCVWAGSKMDIFCRVAKTMISCLSISLYLAEGETKKACNSQLLNIIVQTFAPFWQIKTMLRHHVRNDPQLLAYILKESCLNTTNTFLKRSTYLYSIFLLFIDKKMIESKSMIS